MQIKLCVINHKTNSIHDNFRVYRYYEKTILQKIKNFKGFYRKVFSLLAYDTNTYVYTTYYIYVCLHYIHVYITASIMNICCTQ